MNETSKRFHQIPSLPDLTSETFFKVFPFCILIDPSMRITHLGKSIQNLFPYDTLLCGRYLDEVFRLIRPDILLEWNKVLFSLLSVDSHSSFVFQLLSYGRHIVFLMESRLPLRSDKRSRPQGETTGSSAIRLKGQMKWIRNWNMIVFLCHPMFVFSSHLSLLKTRKGFFSLATTEEMLNIGLTLHDLNFYDGSSEILIAGMQHARHLQAAIDKVSLLGKRILMNDFECL